MARSDFLTKSTSTSVEYSFSSATIDQLGLPGISHLLHVDPDRLAGDWGDGADGGLHLGVEQPQGSYASGREREMSMIYTYTVTN
jgi:hypothetical protein